MYNRIMIIGLGSVGSFVAQGISYLQSLQKLVLVDHDYVENSNLPRSVYTSKYVGRSKAFSLAEILSNTTEAEIEAFPSKYSESEFTKNDVDLIIDCRDVVTDRNIDSVKISISDRILLIDGRKISYGKTIPGSYISEVGILDLMNVSNIISGMVQSGAIKDLINGDRVLEIPLDSDKSEIQEKISSASGKTKTDIVYDPIEDTRISNIGEIVQKVSELKEDNQIIIELMTKSKNESCIVYKNTFESTYEIIEFISNSIKSEPYESFILCMKDNKIEIIPDVGAA